MRALIVYESMFGNTEAVADAVRAGVEPVMPVDLVQVGDAPGIGALEVDLLVVGAPTHAFSLSRESTRADAAQRRGGTTVTGTAGLREWLDAGTAPAGLPAAAFDTHVKTPKLPGRASKAAEKRLRHAGATMVAPAESFYVDGYEGPVLDGELERARAWGESLATQVQDRVGV